VLDYAVYCVSVIGLCYILCILQHFVWGGRFFPDTVYITGSFRVKSTNFAKVPHVTISDLVCFWSTHTPILVKYTCKISAPNFHPLVIYAHFSERGVVKNCWRSQFSCIFTLSYLRMYDV